MPIIVPAVLASTPDEYARDLAVATSLSSRIQIDLADGEFALNQTINLVQAYWPKNVLADVHLMYHTPGDHIEQLISMQPNMVIVHFEANDSAKVSTLEMLAELKGSGIKTGVALLQGTTVNEAGHFIEQADHALVFTGDLGHYGGELKKECLSKIKELKLFKPGLEVGVDGGINDTNAAEVVVAGADVLNIGSFLQKAKDPEAAYAKLRNIVDRS